VNQITGILEARVGSRAIVNLSVLSKRMTNRFKKIFFEDIPKLQIVQNN
jgi:hypothetical protein